MMLTDSARRKNDRKKRANNFCEKDVKLLLSILRYTDEGRLLAAVCNTGGKREDIAAKDQAWLEVYGHFLTSGGDPTFEVDTLRTKFKNIKKSLRAKYTDEEWSGFKPEMLDPDSYFEEIAKYSRKEEADYQRRPKRRRLNLERSRRYPERLRQPPDTYVPIQPKKTAMQFKWVDFETSIGQVFQDMRLSQEGLDITLICDDGVQVQAHKVIVAACSPFLREIVNAIPNQHPYIYLKGIGSLEMEALLDFMYCGKTAVRPHILKTFLGAAQDLKIKGLATELVQSSKFPGSATKYFKNVKEEPGADGQLDSTATGSEKQDESLIMEVDIENDKARKLRRDHDDDDDDDDEDEDDEDGFDSEEEEEEEDSDEEDIKNKPDMGVGHIDHQHQQPDPQHQLQAQHQQQHHVSATGEIQDLSDVKNSLPTSSHTQQELDMKVPMMTTQNTIPQGEKPREHVQAPHQPMLFQQHIPPQQDLLNQDKYNKDLAGKVQSNVCKTCGQDFGNSPVALMVHQSRDHAVPAPRCKLCDKHFVGDDYLMAHIQSAHPEAYIRLGYGGVHH